MPAALKPERFLQLTRHDEFARVIEGIESVARAGFTGLKLDTVAIRGFNDDELVDLIEHFDHEHARKRPARPAVEIDLSRIDTDDPVAVVDGLEGRMAFYAFTER